MNAAQELSGRENIGMVPGDKFNHRHVARLSSYAARVCKRLPALQ